MKGTIYLDMDGTLADLYGVNDWLQFLHKNKPTPYAIAKPLDDFEITRKLLKAYKREGYRIGIITWGSKGASKDFDENVKYVKKNWLAHKKLWEFVQEDFHFLHYGTPKKSVANGDGKQILIDDDEKNCVDWRRASEAIAYNPTIDGLNLTLATILERIIEGRI